MKIYSKAFFSNYIFHPFKKELSTGDKVKAFVTSVALGVFTAGIFHAACYFKYRNKTVNNPPRNQSSSDVQKIAKKAKIIPPSSQTQTTDEKKPPFNTDQPTNPKITESESKKQSLAGRSTSSKKNSNEDVGESTGSRKILHTDEQRISYIHNCLINDDPLEAEKSIKFLSHPRSIEDMMEKLFTYYLNKNNLADALKIKNDPLLAHPNPQRERSLLSQLCYFYISTYEFDKVQEILDKTNFSTTQKNTILTEMLNKKDQKLHASFENHLNSKETDSAFEVALLVHSTNLKDLFLQRLFQHQLKNKPVDFFKLQRILDPISNNYKLKNPISEELCTLYISNHKFDEAKAIINKFDISDKDSKKLKKTLFANLANAYIDADMLPNAAKAIDDLSELKPIRRIRIQLWTSLFNKSISLNQLDIASQSLAKLKIETPPKDISVFHTSLVVLFDKYIEQQKKDLASSLIQDVEHNDHLKLHLTNKLVKILTLEP